MKKIIYCTFKFEVTASSDKSLKRAKEAIVKECPRDLTSCGINDLGSFRVKRCMPGKLK